VNSAREQQRENAGRDEVVDTLQISNNELATTDYGGIDALILDHQDLGGTACFLTPNDVAYSQDRTAESESMGKTLTGAKGHHIVETTAVPHQG